MTAVLALAVARLVGASQPIDSVSFSVTHIEDAHPQFIHIYNLEGGPRAIQLFRPPSDDDDSSRPIRIFNILPEGVQEIAQPSK
jgi:hypothetical protein